MSKQSQSHDQFSKTESRLSSEQQSEHSLFITNCVPKLLDCFLVKQSPLLISTDSSFNSDMTGASCLDMHKGNIGLQICELVHNITLKYQLSRPISVVVVTTEANRLIAPDFMERFELKHCGQYLKS